MGGGHSFGGSHASGAHYGGFAGGPRYAPRGGYAGFHGGYATSGASAHIYSGGYNRGAVSTFRGGPANRSYGSGYAGRGGSGYAGRGAYGPGFGRGGFGYHRPYWGGGYWHGGYWPRCWYGWGYPWFLGVLPGFYATYFWGGVPYYYVNNVYYTWDSGYNGYVVTDPPPVTDEAVAAPNGPEDASDAVQDGTSGGGEVYVYPRNGQSEEQTATDRYECHKWAVSQSGFDPTKGAQASGNSADYRRALGACMDGRGYSAK